MSPGFVPPALYDGRYVVAAADVGSTDVVATDTRSGRAIARIEPQPGHHFDYRFLDAPWLVWTEVNNDNLRQITAYRLDLRTGERISLNATPGVQEPGVPQVWFAAKGRAAYTTQRGKRNCITVLTLRSLHSGIARCVLRPNGISFPRLGGGAVTEWKPRPKPDGCRTVVTVPLIESESAQAVPAQEPCAPYSGVAGPDFVAWDEHDRFDDPDESDVYATVRGGRLVQHLDHALTASERVCGRWLYWTVHIPGDKGTEIRRWRPGTDIEIIYRSHPDYATMSAPYCQNDLITFTRAWTGRGAGSQQLIAGSADASTG